MKTKNIGLLSILSFSLVLALSICSPKPQYNFSLKNTLAIFMINSKNDNFFCIPVQYTGDYQIQNFDFDNGLIKIGDYELLFNRDDVIIHTYFNEFDPEENFYNHYIFIEKHLKKDEIKKIIKEYEKGNVYSLFYISYDVTVDNQLQAGNGLYDDFELSNEPLVDTTWFSENLDFFKAKYLQK